MFDLDEDPIHARQRPQHALALENRIILAGPDDFKVKAMWEVLQQKLVRRHVPLRNLKAGKIEQVAKGRYMLPEGEAVPRKKSPPSKMSLARVIRDMVDRAVKNRFEAWEEDFARRIGG